MAKVLTVDPQDVSQLVHRHQAEVWRYVRFLGANAELADDLVQEAFLQLLRAPYEDQGEPARRAWLRKVAQNLYVKSFRRPPFALVDLDRIEAVWLDYAQGDGGNESLAALRECLENLDGRARQAVRLHYEERRSRREIGDRLELGEQGVKSLLRRSRELLKKCVERARREA